MKYALPSLLFLIISLSATKAQHEVKLLSSQPFTIGETVEIHSEILNENRTLNIYLPQNYSDTAKGYNVIYLLDGSADEDFVHVAGLVQFATFPWIEMMPESIVIGIANVDRKRDFTFPTTITKDREDFPTTGGSYDFIEFIERELQPYVEQQYKTSGKGTIVGQSLGGLLATEVLFQKPELFDSYIIISPSLWWNNQSLLKISPKSGEKKKIYIGVGKEGEVMENDAKALAKLLEKQGHQVYFEHFGGQDHANILHLALYSAFREIYKKED